MRNSHYAAAARRWKALQLAGPLAGAWPVSEQAAAVPTCVNCGDALSRRRQRTGKDRCSGLCDHPFDLFDYRQCIVCGSRFTARTSDAGHRKTCSTECAERHRRQLSNARKRNREHAERAGVSDVTNAQELAMRRRARKCPLCSVYMTGKAGLPNSKHLDHILPIGVGGTHTHGNVRIICRTCNLRRPLDGSDYLGTLTLWADAPGAVTRASLSAPSSAPGS